MPNEEIRELRNKLRQLQEEDNQSAAVVDTLNDIAYAYYSINPDTGVEYAKEAREIAETIGYERGVGRSYNAQGISTMTKGEYPETLKLFERCLNIYKNP